MIANTRTLEYSIMNIQMIYPEQQEFIFDMRLKYVIGIC